MSKQGGRIERDVGMARAARAADPVWWDGMWKCLQIVARRQAELTADDVFALAKKCRVKATHENRAFGPLMLRAESVGYVEITPRFKSSNRTSKHLNPIRVWKSLVHGGQPLISKKLRKQRALFT